VALVELPAAVRQLKVLELKTFYDQNPPGEVE